MNLPEGFVPDTVYLLETEGEYVGIFNLRHRLTEGLIHGAGHIGYGISPKYRGKGYAAKGLEMLLEIARKIVPEEEIYLSVHKDNLASLNVQKKNGAYIHHENEAEYFTRIPLKRDRGYRKFMVHLMQKQYKIEILLDYEQKRITKLQELTLEW